MINGLSRDGLAGRLPAIKGWLLGLFCLLCGVSIVLLAVMPAFLRLVPVVFLLCLGMGLFIKDWLSTALLSSLWLAFFLEVTLGQNLSEIRGLSLTNFVLGLSLLTMFVFGLVKEGRPFDPGPVGVPLLILAFYGLFSMLITYASGGYSWKSPSQPGLLAIDGLGDLLLAFFNSLRFLFIYLAAFNLPRTRKEIRVILLFVFAFLVATHLFNFFGSLGLASSASFEISSEGGETKFSGPYTPGARLRGTLIEPNVFGAFLSLFTPFLLCGIFVFRKPLLKILSLASTGLSFGLLLLTGSRGGFLGMFVAILILAVLLKKSGRLGFPAAAGLIAGLILAVMLFAVFFPQAFQANVLARLSPDKIGSLRELGHGRLEMWSLGWREFLRHPLFGTGWMGFWDVHNTFLRKLVTLGLPGLILLLCVYFRAARVSFRATAKGEDASAVVLNAAFLAGLAGVLTSVFFVEILNLEHLLFLYMGLVLRYNQLGCRESQGMT